MLNKIIVYGNLVATPELKQLTSGNSFCQFSIACKRNYRSKNGNYEADFFDIIAYAGQAELICKNFQKGQPIIIVGSLETSNYEDKQGNKRKSYAIRASEVNFAGYKDQNYVTDDPRVSVPNGSYLPGEYGGSNNEFQPIEQNSELPF